MHISVSAGDLKIGSRLPEYIEEKLSHEVEKYFKGAVEAVVHFKKQRNFIYTVIIVNVGSKRDFTLKADAKYEEIHRSFDLALDKMAVQLKKHKEKLKTHKE